MGWWKTEHGTIGDEVADVLYPFWDAVESTYLKDVGRLPTQGEVADLIEFGSRGVFKVQCGDPKAAFSARIIDKDTPRAAKPGAQGCFGQPRPPGKMATIDPDTGKHWDERRLDEEDTKIE